MASDSLILHRRSEQQFLLIDTVSCAGLVPSPSEGGGLLNEFPMFSRIAAIRSSSSIRVAALGMTIFLIRLMAIWATILPGSAWHNRMFCSAIPHVFRLSTIADHLANRHAFVKLLKDRRSMMVRADSNFRFDSLTDIAALVGCG
jgi:hypothetical protein